jgi:NAD(P) transhydrogenase subunit alpha
MLVTNLAILVLAGFVGFAVISKVPNTLHTPLMSGTNAIHGIVVLAGLLVVGFSGNDLFNKVILVIAIAFGTINVVGGFLVTDRMLAMFKRKPEPPKEVEDAPEPKPPGEPTAAPAPEVEESPEAEAEPPAAPKADA